MYMMDLAPPIVRKERRFQIKNLITKHNLVSN